MARSYRAICTLYTLYFLANNYHIYFYKYLPATQLLKYAIIISLICSSSTYNKHSLVRSYGETSCYELHVFCHKKHGQYLGRVKKC